MIDYLRQISGFYLVLHSLDLIIHLFRFFSVETVKAQPDNKCDRQLDCCNYDSLCHSSGSSEPADSISNDRIDNTTDSHMDYHLDRHGHALIVIYNRRNAEPQTYDQAPYDHLRELVVLKRETALISYIKYYSCQAENG